MFGIHSVFAFVSFTAQLGRSFVLELKIINEESKSCGFLLWISNATCNASLVKGLEHLALFFASKSALP